jgi:hypothetical protein
MDKDMLIKVRCSHFISSGIRKDCLMDDCSTTLGKNFMYCNEEFDVTWTNFIINRKHLIKVKNEI